MVIARVTVVVARAARSLAHNILIFASGTVHTTRLLHCALESSSFACLACHLPCCRLVATSLAIVTVSLTRRALSTTRFACIAHSSAFAALRVSRCAWQTPDLTGHILELTRKTSKAMRLSCAVLKMACRAAFARALKTERVHRGMIACRGAHTPGRTASALAVCGCGVLHDDVLRDRARCQSRALSIMVRARTARFPLRVRARCVCMARAIVVRARRCLFPLCIQATRMR